MTAEWLTQHRIFPRAFSIFYLWLTAEVAFWFMALPGPSIEQAGFATGWATTAAAWFKFYAETGRPMK